MSKRSSPTSPAKQRSGGPQSRARARTPAGGSGRRPFPLLPLAAGAVALLAAVAVVIGMVSGDDSPDTAGVEETRLASVTGAALAPFAGDGADPAVGKPAPEVDGAGFGGEPVRIAADGRPTLVVFVAHWCPHCRNEVPEIVDWTGSGAPEGVDVIGVSTGVDANRPNYPPSAWLEEEGWDIPTIADSDAGDVATRFGLTGFPYFVAVDASGNVAARATGELTTAQLEALADVARG